MYFSKQSHIAERIFTLGLALYRTENLGGLGQGLFGFGKAEAN